MRRRDWLIGLGVAFVIAALVSPWASSAPDGLEWAAERLGFMERVAEHPSLAAPLAQYTTPGVEDESASTAITGVVGTLLVAIVLVGLGLLFRRRTSASGDVGQQPGNA